MQFNINRIIGGNHIIFECKRPFYSKAVCILVFTDIQINLKCHDIG